MTERPPDTGWLGDTPIDDNVVRRFLFNQADAYDIIAEGFAGMTERSDDVALAASTCAVPYFNEAVLLRPVFDADDPVLDTTESFFMDSPAASWVLLSAWPTPSLVPRGWIPVGHPAFVLRTPGAPLRDPAPRPGVDLVVRRVTEADDVLAAEKLFVDGYPVDEAIGRPGEALPATLGSSAMSLRLATVNGADVAVGAGHVGHGVVNLCGAATLPEARRTGAWGALVRARCADAPDLPAAAFTSDYSRPGFEHLGFVSVMRFTMWFKSRS